MREPVPPGALDAIDALLGRLDALVAEMRPILTHLEYISATCQAQLERTRALAQEEGGPDGLASLDVPGT